MVEGMNNTDSVISHYNMTFENLQTLASMTANIASVSAEPNGYLVLSQYSSPHCEGELGSQFAYPVDVCVDYGATSERVSVIELGPVLIITIARYHGTNCHVFIYSHAIHVVRNNLCASPFELTYSADLPATGPGVVKE
jgi:hypothetical protein